MTEYGHSASISGDAGWCIHGMPYGDDWTCAACGSPNADMHVTFRTTEPPVFTRADVDHLMHLLSSIEYQLRTRR